MENQAFHRAAIARYDDGHVWPDIQLEFLTLATTNYKRGRSFPSLIESSFAQQGLHFIRGHGRLLAFVDNAHHIYPRIRTRQASTPSNSGVHLDRNGLSSILSLVFASGDPQNTWRTSWPTSMLLD